MYVCIVNADEHDQNPRWLTENHEERFFFGSMERPKRIKVLRTHDGTSLEFSWEKLCDSINYE